MQINNNHKIENSMIIYAGEKCLIKLASLAAVIEFDSW